MGDDVEGDLGVEARRAERDDGDAVREARHDDVVEAADPGPVGRRPDPVARLREEVVRELEPGQVAGQHAVAVERALRRAGRAGGVDEQGGRVRRRRSRREVGRGGGEHGVEIVVDVDQDAVEAELGRALERRALGDDRARLRATEAHAERVAAERRAQRHHDRARACRSRRGRSRSRAAARGSARPGLPPRRPSRRAHSRAGWRPRVSSPKLTVRVISRPSVTRIAGAAGGWRSETSTPMLTTAGSCHRNDVRSSSYEGGGALTPPTGAAASPGRPASRGRAPRSG